MREKYIREALEDIVRVWDEHGDEARPELVDALLPVINKGRKELWLEDLADAVGDVEKALGIKK